VALMTKEGFISYYPLKQGLKPAEKRLGGTGIDNLYPTIH